ncbi:uncharacterized protein [Aegilops tauschii subsp. strangulata]|uniref:uncharacterized protein n=1 Tax=Aegilops tauschii subsp. strangulata TaxID=200361 RepID=UPI003CC8A6F2
MADTENCQLCGAQDSWRHSLMECSASRRVWALADGDIVDHVETTREPNAKSWIFAMIESLSHKKLTELFVTLWAIWTARRKSIHEGNLQSPHATHSFIVSFIAELESLQNTERPRGERVRAAMAGSTSHQIWRPPGEGFVKINVDGGFSRNGERGAAAAVCRHNNGTFFGSSAMVFEGINDAATLESLACREALSLAPDLMEDRIVVACDSKSVVADISKGTEGRYSAIVKEIVIRSREFSTCDIKFEGQALNWEAHSLAKFSSSLDVGRHVWLGDPRDPLISPVNLNINQ